MSKIRFLAAFFIAAVLAQDATDRTCVLRCRPNQPPQCGSFNGTTYRLFRSNCARRARNCSNNENWVRVDMSFCRRFFCPLSCTTRRNIICATNGIRTERFLNRCVFLNYACTSTLVWRPLSSCSTGTSTGNGVQIRIG